MEQQQLMAAQKGEYKSTLDHLKTSKQYESQTKQKSDLYQEKLAGGFQFECYTRDQLIAQEK